jgi:hypothetical protein
MNLLKHISAIFFSLRTSLWLLGVMLVLMLVGAFIMPGRQEFQVLHSVPLLDWLQTQPLEVTWWLWGLIGVLAVLTVNTLFCSVESIAKKRKVTQWLLLISPQIIHAGFLCMLLAHLLSAAGASQEMTAAREGSIVKLADDETVLKVENINIRLDYYGYVTDWEVGVSFLSEGKAFLKDIIKPNNPSVHRGFNINVKDLRSYPEEAVLLQINREPGAYWALAGGVLFMVGIMVLIVLRIKMEK